MRYRVKTTLQIALIVSDLLLLWVALFASAFWAGSPQPGDGIALLFREWAFYAALAAVWAITTSALGTYRAVRNRLAYQELAHVIKAATTSYVILAGLLYLAAERLSTWRYWCFIGLSLAALVGFRLALRIGYRQLFHRAWSSAMFAPARVVVVGEGRVLYDTLCTLSKCDPREVALVGYFDYQEDLERALSKAMRQRTVTGLLTQVEAGRTDGIPGGAYGLPPSGHESHDTARSSGLYKTSDYITPGDVIEPLYTAASFLAAQRMLESEATGNRAPKKSRHTDAPSSFGKMQQGASPLSREVERLVIENRADNVVVAMARKRHDLLSRLVAQLQRLPVHIVLVPDVTDLTILKVGVTELGEAPALKLRAPMLSDMELALKRALDLALVLGIMPLLLPLMGLVALAIKLDSPGPVVFRQRRIGQYGKPFTIFKFRTMVHDAEERLREVTTFTDDGKPLFKNDSGDPRITRVGRVLRRLSLDETPQFFNVLRGQMSLVGPRPELPRYVNYYDTWQHFRLWVPPGITGWWQVKAREKQPMYMHWDDDIYYIKNYSLLLDLQILWMTLSSAFAGGTGR